MIRKALVALIALSPTSLIGITACAPLRGDPGSAVCNSSSARSAVYALLGQESLSSDPGDQGAISTLATFRTKAASDSRETNHHLECRGVVTFRAPYKGYATTSGPFSFSRDPSPDGTRFIYKLNPFPTSTEAKALAWAALIRPPLLTSDYGPIAAWRVVNAAPTLVGDCTLTRVKEKGTRLQEPTADGYVDVPGSGSAVVFENGIAQVSYNTVAAVESSSAGDPVKLCLIQVPASCPAGDERGKIYSALDLKTGAQWFLPDSEHSCGGA